MHAEFQRIIRSGPRVFFIQKEVNGAERSPDKNRVRSVHSIYSEEQMKNKLFKVFALFTLACMLLAACGGGAAAEDKVLRVWIQWGDNPQQIQTLFDKYTEESGIKVEVTAPLEEDKILPALTGSEPPDVLVLSGGDLVKSYYKQGLVDDLTSTIQSGGIDLNDFFDA